MTMGLALTLVGLALVDSLSFGTFGIPIVLLLSSDRTPVGRLLIYLGTVAVFYFGVGIALMFGLDAAIGLVGTALQGSLGYWIELVLGVGLFALSFRLDPKRRKDRPVRSWTPKLGGPGAMVTLGLTAALVEVATMLPYLAAIGMMKNAGLPVVLWLPVLAGYVVVMVVPALAVLGLRLLASAWLQPKLERLRAWLVKNSAGALSWTVAIVGFLLARDGGYHLALEWGWITLKGS